jgi:hypothetical protein
MAACDVNELQETATFRNIIFQTLQTQTVYLEVNRFVSTIPNSEGIIARNRSTVIGRRY